MIRFGPFELDEVTGELRREGTVVPIAPQPSRLLQVLAGRPGELVTREELCRSIWGQETFVDFERGLNFCVLQARTALGDDAKNPRYIQTLPKRGYRFVAPVAAEIRPSASRRPLLGRASLAMAGAALLVFVVAAWQQRHPASAATRETIAVLPFANLSGPADAHFADGMTEELITHLGRLRPQRLAVIARTSVVRYREAGKDVRAIDRELGVRYVVEGTVRRDGDRLRVTAQLIDARDQTHLWAESFDRRGTGSITIQEDIAARIARALRIELLDESRLVTTSPAAHEAYLRGRQLWHRRDAASVEASVVELRRAVQLDPGFVLGHIALAESIHSLAMRERISSAEAAREIRGASEAALRLAPSLAQSHSITAMLRYWYEWDWAGAEESYQKAIALNPGEPGALHDHGWLLITRGRPDEGIAEIRRAQELDPVSPRANMHVAWAYIHTRRYADAVREARRALELSPGLHEAYWCLHHAYLLSGNVASAREARKHLPPQGATTDPYEKAVRFAMAGDHDAAVQWLESAKRDRNPSFVLAGADPKLDTLHDDPRFRRMLDEVGLRVLRPRR